MKSLSVNGFEAEVIPSACLVAMEIKRLAREQGKAVTVQEIREPKPGEGRVLKLIGKTLLIVGGLYFSIHLLIWAVK
jgi:hypothetical protein